MAKPLLDAPLAADPVDVAFDEFCRLREQGQPVDAEEFCGRYPTFQSSLRRAVGAWLLLDAHPSMLGATAEVHWPQVGERFLSWMLEEELGRGAFGRVFRAREPALGDRQVVLKLSPGGGSEAWTLGRLDHENVVPILSVCEAPGAGLTAVCMPYLGRATLCHLLDLVQARGPTLSADALAALGDAALWSEGYVQGVVRLGLQIAEALAYLHGQGVVHRDLKPSNVLLTPRGRAVLVDFNLSQDRVAGRVPIGGTPAYMAPEQLDALDSGVAEREGPAADLFALGVVLYELLAGRHPFGPLPLNLNEEERRKLLHQRHRDGAPPLRGCHPHVSPELERIVFRCLAFDAEQRHASAAALADDLRRCAKQRGSSRRKRFVMVGMGGLLAVILAGSVVFGARSRQDSEEEGRRSFRAGQYDRAAEQFKKALERDPDSPRLLLALGRSQQRRGNLPAALEYLEASNRRTPHGRGLAAWSYALAEAKHFETSRSVGRQAAEHEPRNAAVWNNLGHCALKLHELDEAGRHLDRALAEDANLIAARVNRAELDVRRCAADPKHVPRQGIDDLRRAEQRGASGAAFHYLGAYLCVLACERGLDVRSQGIDWLARTVAQGRTREQLGKTLQPWFDRLPEEQRRVRTPNTIPLPTLADPLPDE